MTDTQRSWHPPQWWKPSYDPSLSAINARDGMKFGFYGLLAEARRRAEAAGEGLTLAAYELKVFSQNGEDGVTLEVLRRIGATSRFFVEFGASYGHELNTRILYDLLGWRGVLIERDANAFQRLRETVKGRERQLRTHHGEVTASNVNVLFRELGIPPNLDVLSIDVDGQDFYIWQALQDYQPRLVIIEYNGTIAPAPLVQPPAHPGWSGTDFFGSSIEGLIELGRSKGYTLVHTEMCGLNAFFVRNELVERLGPVTPPLRVATYDLRLGGAIADNTDQTYIRPTLETGSDDSPRTA